MAGTIVVDRIESDSSYTSSINVASKVNFTGGMQIGGQDSTFGGMRNRIINGDMKVDQRYNGAANTLLANTAPFVIDRYYQQSYGSGRITVQRDSDIPSTAPVANSMAITVSTAQTTFGTTNDIFETIQQIEGTNLSDLKWGTAQAKPCVLSFWVKSSVVGTYAIAVQNSNQTGVGFDSCCTNYSISQANTWEKKTIVIPPATGGDWSLLNRTGFAVQLRWCLGTGTDRTFANQNNVWGSGNCVRLTGTTYAPFMSTSSNVWKMTGVQFEVGTVPTEFEQRSLTMETLLCQRYFEKISYVGSSYFNGTNGMGQYMQYKVLKRATPSISLDNLNWNSWYTNFGGTWNVDLITTDRFTINPIGSAVGFSRFSADFTIYSEW